MVSNNGHDARNIISACHECVINTLDTNPEPLQMSALPKGHWMNIYLDLCGPLPSGNYLVVIVDEYSNYPIVETTRSLAAEKIIPIIDKYFEMFAYPIVLKTDNRTPFQSKLWSDFCIHRNVKHNNTILYILGGKKNSEILKFIV